MNTQQTSRKKDSRKKHRSIGRDHGLRIVSFDEVASDLLILFSELGLGTLPKGKALRTFRHSPKIPISEWHRAPNTFAISDLLTLWHQDVNYLDSAGKPLPLRMRSTRGSFRSLANKAVPNMTPAQLLIELKRLKAVRVDDKGLIHVRQRSLRIYKDKRHRAIHTLNSLSGFINTLRHNLKSGLDNSEKIFHRVAWNRGFDAAQIPNLKIWLERYGQALLETADAWMLKNSANSGSAVKKKNAATEVSVGVYLSIASH